LTLCLLRTGNYLDWKEFTRHFKPLAERSGQEKIAVIVTRRIEPDDQRANKYFYRIHDPSLKKILKGTGAGDLLLTFNEQSIHNSWLNKSTLGSIAEKYHWLAIMNKRTFFQFQVLLRSDRLFPVSSSQHEM
jgi:hypothetical protein